MTTTNVTGSNPFEAALQPNRVSSPISDPRVEVSTEAAASVQSAGAAVPVDKVSRDGTDDNNVMSVDSNPSPNALAKHTSDEKDPLAHARMLKQLSQPTDPSRLV